MRNIIRSIAVGCCFAALAVPASADTKTDKFQTEITFNRSGTTAEIHDEFNRVVNRACRNQVRGQKGARRVGLMYNCRHELLDQAIVKTAVPKMIAYHREETGCRALDGLELASAETETKYSHKQ